MVSHVEAYAFSMPICAHYMKYMAATTNYREPLVAPEQVAAVGDTVYKDMWRMGYSRFFRMSRYDTSPKDMRKSKAKKRGWFTWGWSRPILLGNFIAAVKNGWYQVNSPWTIWEMAHFETHTTGAGKEKQVHSEDATDDGIFANAIAFFCPNDLASLTKRVKKKRTEANEFGEMPEVDFGVGGTWSTKVTPISEEWRSRLESLE